jgi:dihydrofolate reductase
MRRVIVSNLMSVDGLFEGPNIDLDWFSPDEEFFEYARAMLRSVDTILFGRSTYQYMAGYWPFAPADEIADKMNGLPKVVFSSSLDKAEWSNSRLVRGDAAEEVAKLKRAPGGDMVILGSAMLASSLLKAGLIDEYRVILAPILIGAGKPLFGHFKDRLKLKLSRTQTLSSGVVVLYYQPAAAI